MANTVYTGVNGSGKSYEAVKTVILGALRSGRRVVSNISGLDRVKIFEYLGGGFDDDRLCIVNSEDVTRPHFFCDPDVDAPSVVRMGDLVVLDEVWSFWGKNIKLLPAHEKFFRMHRHYVDEKTGVCCDLLVVTQNLSSLNVGLRGVVETNYLFTKLKSLGFSSKYRIQIYEGGKQTKSALVSVLYGSYDKKIFPLYKSYVGGKGAEMSADARQSLFKNPYFVYGMGSAVVLLFYYGYGIYGYLAGMGAKSDHASSPVMQSSALTPSASSGSVSRMADGRRLMAVISSTYGDGYSVIREPDGTYALRVLTGVSSGWSSKVEGASFVFKEINNEKSSTTSIVPSLSR
jgi:zona occludens toxin